MYRLIRSGLDPKKTLPNSCNKNWVLSVKAEPDEAGADPNIFVYQTNTWNADVGDMFVDVADVHDLNFLPVGKSFVFDEDEEHAVEDYVPYYRLDSVTLDCYTATEAEEIWWKIRGRVRALVREYKAARALIEKEVFNA